MPTGYQSNVIPGTPILSAWGNLIRDRTIPTFDTIAQRDSQWTSPPEGAMCYVVATKMYYYYAVAAITGAWYPLQVWRSAWGVLPNGYAQYAAAQSAIGNVELDMTGLIINPVVRADRMYRTTIRSNPSTNVANDGVAIRVTSETNVQLSITRITLVNAGVTYAGVLTQLVETFTVPGTITRKGRVQRDTGTGAVSLVNAAASMSWILMEDIGPAPGVTAPMIPMMEGISE